MVATTPQAILASLRGQTITLYDLNAFFTGWPRGVNPDLGKLRSAVDAWLDCTMKQSPSLDALKKSDFGYFGATWWPRARLDRLTIVTFLAIWLFTWDDEIDSQAGSLWKDYTRSQNFRADTLDYVRFCLGLPSEKCWKDVKPSSQIICNFEVIGKAIREAYNTEQRERVLTQMELFIQMSEREQRLRLDMTLPSVEAFWECRLGSSAVAVCLALNEFVCDHTSKLPYSTIDRGDMKLLGWETNVIVSTVNDMLSLKKEIALGSVESLIPILYSQNDSAQAAVDQATRFLIKSIQTFDQVAQRLIANSTWNEIIPLLSYVEGCRYCCTGNLTWSYSTQRYGINQEDLRDGGSLKITL